MTEYYYLKPGDRIFTGDEWSYVGKNEWKETLNFTELNVKYTGKTAKTRIYRREILVSEREIKK